MSVVGDRPLLGMRVLVVGGSDINLDVTKRILEQEGAQVLLASNGQEAFERIQAESRCIDAVLMDVQMPVLDGSDAARRIRRELPDLPIIAMTVDGATPVGMNDHIVKPFDPQTLVSSILRRVRPSARERIPWPVIEGIDSTDAHERLSGDFNLFQLMLKRLINEFSDVALPSALEDPSVLAVHAGRMHKLRGSAGMLGATVIHQLASEAEGACAAGETARAAQLATQLATRLKTLSENAALISTVTHIQQAQPQLSSDEGFDPQDLADLINLLHRQSLSAMDRFSAISPQLRSFLGQDAYERVSDHIDNLRFDQAAKVLEENPL